MTQGTHDVGMVQVLGEGHLHGGPIWGALYILVLLWCYDLQHQDITRMAPHYTKILQVCLSQLQDVTAAAAADLQQIKFHALLMMLKLDKVTYTLSHIACELVGCQGNIQGHDH